MDHKTISQPLPSSIKRKRGCTYRARENMLIYALPKLIAPNSHKVSGRNIKEETHKREKLINATATGAPYNMHVYLAKY